MAFNWNSEEGQNLRTVLLTNHFELLTRAKVNFLYANYLNYPENEKVDLYLKKHYSFTVFRVACFRASWIALANLFLSKRTEQFNLPQLINDLKNSKYGVDVIPESLLDDWEKQIKTTFDPISKDFTEIRDKMFVHLDENRPNKTDISLSYSHISDLLQLAEEIIYYLKEVIGGGQAIIKEELDDFKKEITLLANITRE